MPEYNCSNFGQCNISARECNYTCRLHNRSCWDCADIVVSGKEYEETHCKYNCKDLAKNDMPCVRYPGMK